MKTLDEVRRDRVMLFDVKTITDRFAQYSVDIGERFDALTAAMEEVIVLLEKIEKNTTPTNVLPFPTHGHQMTPNLEMEK